MSFQILIAHLLLNNISLYEMLQFIHVLIEECLYGFQVGIIMKKLLQASAYRFLCEKKFSTHLGVQLLDHMVKLCLFS